MKSSSLARYGLGSTRILIRCSSLVFLVAIISGARVSERGIVNVFGAPRGVEGFATSNIKRGVSVRRICAKRTFRANYIGIDPTEQAVSADFEARTCERALPPVGE